MKESYMSAKNEHVEAALQTTQSTMNREHSALVH